MGETTKMVVDEKKEIVNRLDEIARTEGTSRAALVRRAIRTMYFSAPSFTDNGKISKLEKENSNEE